MIVETAERAREAAIAPDLSAFLREYYGRRLGGARDLKEKACCTDETARRYKDVLQLIPSEPKERHYGCGCPLPDDDLRGLSVLDLGSGAGVDAFVASYLVGPEGRVVGIDMTEEQLDVARRNAPIVARRFGYREANTAFHEGFIETAEAVGDGSMDLVISDCVVNLSPRKDKVFATSLRVLKEGGELHFSDIYADRRVPDAIRNDSELIAECLGMAEYEHDAFDLMKDAGFLDPRVVLRAVVQTEVKGEPIVFSSITVRAFKLTRPPLDRRCEDYGQLATYLGTVEGREARFALDDHHLFEAHRPSPVCRNTARMLKETRLARHFRVTDEIRHFGLFACGPAPAAAAPPAAAGGACC